ncbi:DUF488 family protein [Cryobacterium adonitolivorans]|uniref:DUF488 family protein n=1 Tax=Cryobacterium adonitolivorans TaxID=1259189 RepID=A0A4R8VZB3_9MICO|nr:DUF488 family protein [Cryobacterium adonitolivorans]TFB98732.1 DUF488 family protein [Cryobacterium adonitolivorans]
MAFRIKRIHDDASADDGCRVLVDRLWPRGISRERARLDAWLKDVAPSPTLRTWWNHDPDRIDEFTARYRAELDTEPNTARAVTELRELAARNPSGTTLLYGARDAHINHARILADYLAAGPGD